MLEPAGALPHRATRLDPVGPLQADERRLELEALVVGDDGGRLRGPGAGTALLRAVQDRGGLPPAATGSALVGALDGVRVVLLGPVDGIPLWCTDVGVGGDADVLRLEGHAVLDATTPVHHAGELAPRAAVLAAVDAAVTRLAGRGSGALLVLGGGPHVEAAVTGARGAGRRVVAVAAGLAEATRLDELGAKVVVDLGDTPREAVDRLATALATARQDTSALVLGPTPPGAPSDDPGPVAEPPSELAGILAGVVEVVGNVDVAQLAARTGATVLLRPLGELHASTSSGGTPWG